MIDRHRAREIRDLLRIQRDRRYEPEILEIYCFDGVPSNLKE